MREVGNSLSVDLDQVIAHGAPAQRAEALRLRTILGVSPDDAETTLTARQLIDAYLNDPHLERG
ncbi:MAG: hypothetical protein EBZ75_15210 [Oxalobacteraceae bacterium]|nr:hypothetical protein [Oxalobacteraceae bacterium]